MPEMRQITSGLQFPEGPVALADGSVVVVEIKRGTLTRVAPDGKQTIVATTGGGPNGAAIGPDGLVYVCNNGGFEWHDVGGLLVPGNQAHDYSGGRIQRVDLATGRVWSWELAGPGEVVAGSGFGPAGGTLLAGLPGFQLFDSLAVDGAGNVCVATLVTGAITVISPGGAVIEQVPTGDPLTTNLCFGGRELRTAYVTASGTGRLLATEWPRPGLRLAYQ